MKLDLYDTKGDIKAEKIEVSDSIWNVDINEEVLNQYIYVYLSNQRQANSKAKDRSEVSGGGRKPWKQKGTGRARVGSNRSPLWRGGGVTFGPTKEQQYKKSLPKKMKKLAYCSALTMKNKDNSVVITEKPQISKTKQATEYLAKFNVNRNILIVEKDSDLFPIFRNIPGVTVIRAEELNPYIIIKADKIFFIDESVKFIEENLGVSK